MFSRLDERAGGDNARDWRVRKSNAAPTTFRGEGWRDGLGWSRDLDNGICGSMSEPEGGRWTAHRRCPAPTGTATGAWPVRRAPRGPLTAAPGSTQGLQREIGSERHGGRDMRMWVARRDWVRSCWWWRRGRRGFLQRLRLLGREPALTLSGGGQRRPLGRGGGDRVRAVHPGVRRRDEGSRRNRGGAGGLSAGGEHRGRGALGVHALDAQGLLRTHPDARGGRAAGDATERLRLSVGRGIC